MFGIVEVRIEMRDLRGGVVKGKAWLFEMVVLCLFFLFHFPGNFHEIKDSIHSGRQIGT